MSTKKDVIKSSVDPRPAYRVFISSTSDDMREFRDAAIKAMQMAEAIPLGMERFTASVEPVIERCYEEIEKCQFFVAIVGFRYGSIYAESGLSYSELEFNKAEELGKPILVFMREGTIDPSKMDLEDFTKLTAFKKRLQNSGSRRMTTHFTSADQLNAKLYQSLKEEFERQSQKPAQGESSRLTDDADSYMDGAKLYKKFLMMPGKFRGNTVRLRVRFDGHFGSWHLKEELYEAFSIPIGEAVFFNDLFVLGVDFSDMGDEAKHIDCFAVGAAAEWILDNNITKGSVFEGDFTMDWQLAKNVAGKAKLQFGASDAYVCKLILKGSNLHLVSHGNNSRNDDGNSSRMSSQGDILRLLGGLL